MKFVLYEVTDDYDVVIMSGGWGKRLLPITKTLPKALIKLNGKTLIEEKYEDRREILETIFLNKPLKQKLHLNTQDLN